VVRDRGGGGRGGGGEAPGVRGGGGCGNGRRAEVQRAGEGKCGGARGGGRLGCGVGSGSWRRRHCPRRRRDQRALDHDVGRGTEVGVRVRVFAPGGRALVLRGGRCGRGRWEGRLLLLRREGGGGVRGDEGRGEEGRLRGRHDEARGAQRRISGWCRMRLVHVESGGSVGHRRTRCGEGRENGRAVWGLGLFFARNVVMSLKHLWWRQAAGSCWGSDNGHIIAQEELWCGSPLSRGWERRGIWRKNWASQFAIAPSSILSPSPRAAALPTSPKPQPVLVLSPPLPPEGTLYRRPVRARIVKSYFFPPPP
jgi:hypothetical protein